MPKKKLHVFVDRVECKICSGCNRPFPLTDFQKNRNFSWDGLANYCRECASAKSRRNYERNKDRIIAYAHDYYQKNKDSLRDLNRQWVEENKEQNSAYKSQWQRDNRERRNARLMERYHNEPNYRLAVLLRARILRALDNDQKKLDGTLKTLGCSVDFLRQYLESKFLDGMTWDNHGDYWHIDHIRPCATYDLTDPKQYAECFHYTNLQPLIWIDNLKKGGRSVVSDEQ
jgi:hypothetical protein